MLLSVQTWCQSHLRCPLDTKTAHILHGFILILLQDFRIWDSCDVMKARLPNPAVKVLPNSCFMPEIEEHPDILLVPVLSPQTTKVTDHLAFKHRQTLPQAAYSAGTWG